MKWPPYPKYKPSRVEWLGDVPEHWDSKRLKFVLAEPLKYGANEAAELDDPELPRYVRITDIDDNDGLREETFKSLPRDAAGPYLLRENDLLFARSGATAGKTFRYRSSWGVCAYAGYLIRARLDSKRCLPSFARYFTGSTMYWQWISAAFIQATIQNVSADRYANLWVPLPDIPEQRAIVAVLDRETAKIDALLGKKKALIERLKEKRAALISRTVTRGLPPDAARAAGCSPHPRLKPSGVEWLGDVPEHWEVKPIGRLVRFVGGATPDKGNAEYWDGDIPWVSPKDMKRMRITDVPDHVSQDALRNSPLTLLPAQAVLIVVRGMILAHSFPVAITLAPVTINQDMKAITVGKGMGNEFLLWSLTGTAHIFVSLADESAHGTRKLETEVIAKTPLAVPPTHEQVHIARFLERETSKIVQMIMKVETVIERLQEYRSALITAAVTGKIDVRNTETNA